MSFVSNALTEILDETNNELINQISLAKNTDTKIDTLYAMCVRRKSSPNNVKHVLLSQEITAQVPAP